MKKAILFLILLPNFVFAEIFTAVSDTWNPFFFLQQGKFAGIGYEVLMQVMKRTKDQVEIFHVPTRRARMMLKAGSADIFILDAPLWQDQDTVNDVVFSSPIMQVKEYVYALQDLAVIVDSIASLAGTRMNVMSGYVYPSLEDAFASELILKHEVKTEQNLIKSLIYNRCDVIILDSISFNKNIDEMGVSATLFQRGVEISAVDLSIKLHKYKESALPRINQAIAQMKQEGVIDKIINKYVPGQL